MSYLLDKKIKRNKFFKIGSLVLLFLILFYFRSGVYRGLSYVSYTIFRPVFIVGNSVGGTLSNLRSAFLSKNSLYLENQNLKIKLSENNAQMSNYNSVLAENISLKEILGRLPAVAGRGEEGDMILGAILAKPNQSLYDTLIIDVGENSGIEIGDTVFALGDIPIGKIGEVHSASSKVILFSSPGEKMQVVVPPDNIFLEAVGRGGGNFEMAIPQDLNLVKGSEVILPGITPYVLAIVQMTISDPRDSYVKALLVSPVNVQSLKFVQIMTSP